MDKLNLIIESRCIDSIKNVNIIIDPRYVSAIQRMFIDDRK